MFNLEWLHPAYAGLAAIALLLVLPAFFWARHQRRRLARFLPAAGSDASPRRRFWRDLSLLAAVILLGVCLAMPFAGRDQVVETGSSRSLVFVLDASKSMNCRDCREVSRLDYARSWIRELLQGFPGDHVGLVSFAGAASSDCPLTADHKSLFDAAAALEPGLLPAGSDLGAGLREAQRQFPDETAGSRVIILLSDGEELGGDSKSELDKLKQTGIPVIAVALGRSDRNSPVLESDGKPLKRKNGEAVTSRPDYRAMEAIAVASGGLFVPFQPEEPMSGGLLMAGERIKQVSQVQAEEQARSRPRLIYQLILPLVLLVLLIRLCVGERAKSAATSLLILLLPLRLPAEELATPAQALDLHRRVSEALGAGQDVRAEQTKIEEALKIPGLPKALSAALARDLATIRHATSLAKMEFDPGGAVTDATAAIDAYGQALKTEPGSADLIKGLRSAHAARQQALELKRLRDEQKAQEEKKRQQERQKQARQAADNARQAKEEQDKANRERLEERESQSSAPRGEAGEEKAGEEKAGEEKAGEEKAGEEKAGEEKAGEEKAGEEKAGEEKAGEEKAGEEKAGEEKAGEEKAGEEKAGEEKAGEEKAGEEKAGEEKAGEEKAGEEKSEAHQKRAQDLANEAQGQAEGLSHSEQGDSEAAQKAAEAAHALQKAREKMAEAGENPEAGKEASKLLGEAAEKLEALARDGQGDGKGGDSKPDSQAPGKEAAKPEDQKAQAGEVKGGARKPSDQLADQLMEQREQAIVEEVRNQERRRQRQQRRQERVDPGSDK